MGPVCKCDMGPEYANVIWGPYANVIWGPYANVIWGPYANVIWGPYANVIWGPYANVIWGPFYKQDQQLVERVQRRTTKMISSLNKLSYENRIRSLNMPS